MSSLINLQSVLVSSLPLHDALPIFDLLGPAPARGACGRARGEARRLARDRAAGRVVPLGRAIGDPAGGRGARGAGRSEEHTYELQSPYDLVCSLLLYTKNS